ncbi:hypothetical protein BJ878DRAFT_500253, partial [Calycina marina]
MLKLKTIFLTYSWSLSITRCHMHLVTQADLQSHGPRYSQTCFKGQLSSIVYLLPSPNKAPTPNLQDDSYPVIHSTSSVIIALSLLLISVVSPIVSYRNTCANRLRSDTGSVVLCSGVFLDALSLVVDVVDSTIDAGAGTISGLFDCLRLGYWRIFSRSTVRKLLSGDEQQRSRGVSGLSSLLRASNKWTAFLWFGSKSKVSL